VKPLRDSKAHWLEQSRGGDPLFKEAVWPLRQQGDTMSRLASAASGLQNPPSLIQSGNLKFFVMDAPTNENLDLYLKAMEGHEVSHWVRCCEAASYDEAKLASLGIERIVWSFPDGEAPPQNVIGQWLDLCFSAERVVAIHCVAGLGRAPLLVAIALIESGLDAMEAVELIRQKRRGAINRLQLKYLQDYKPSRRKASSGCAVM